MLSFPSRRMKDRKFEHAALRGTLAARLGKVLDETVEGNSGEPSCRVMHAAKCHKTVIEPETERNERTHRGNICRKLSWLYLLAKAGSKMFTRTPLSYKDVSNDLQVYNI